MHTAAAAPCAVALEVSGLECVKADRLLFTDVSFRAAAGDVVRVEGPNGSGKTSLLRILCGLSSAAAGVVRWNGIATTGNRRVVAAQIAYLGHCSAIKVALTAAENLLFHAGIHGVDAGIGVGAALARLGLEGYEDIPCRYLSEGQRRRVALARLLLCPHLAWILDEPLTALDADGAARVEDIVAMQLARGGVVVLTTHQSLNVKARRTVRVNLAS